MEQSKTLCPRSLSHFTGPVVASLKEQRDRLDERAGQLQPHRIRAFEILLGRVEDPINARTGPPHKPIRLLLTTGPPQT